MSVHTGKPKPTVPAQYSIMKGDVIQLIDPNVKQDLREMGKKLTNLRGSL